MKKQTINYKNMIHNILTSISFGLFILTMIHSYVEVKYNLKTGKTTHPSTWFIPGILGAIFWFLYNL
jgi:uncharacterized membrane protein YdcZ (DUF606 family)